MDGGHSCCQLSFRRLRAAAVCVGQAAGFSVYVDRAFAVGDWGRWSGGGHMQADTLGELHEFARASGCVGSGFKLKPGRPEHDHYDLTRAGRELAIKRGEIAEDRRALTKP